MSPEEPVILGAQIAAARQREAEHRSGHGGASALQDVSYTGNESRLWRWADAPADAVVARFVEQYQALGADERAETRAGLRIEDFYTLVTFARRSALSGIRTGDVDVVGRGYGALSVIELDRVDPRDVSWAAAVVGYAAQRLGRPADTLAAGPASRAHSDTAALLTRMAGEQIDLAGAWGLCEVDTGSGPALVDSEHRPYAPDADLGGLAIALADAFEADRYAVTAVTVAVEIPAVWLHGYRPEGVMGCASVSAHLRDGSGPPVMRDMLLAFVAQTQTPAQATALAAAAVADAAASSGGSRSATCLTATSDRLCILLIARAVVQGRQPVEDPASLARFDDELRRLVTP